jgi:transposase
VRALLGALAGADGPGRRSVPTFGASGRQVPSSLGAIQHVLARVAQALEPHSRALATPPRPAPVHSIDETPWLLTQTLQGWGGMVHETAALSMRQPQRSTEALAALSDAWAGLRGSAGYGVYQPGGQARQTCVAHLSRRARGVAARAPPALAACGPWAVAELQRRCQMATAPPSGGEWRAWYARRCKWMEPYPDRADEAGRFARRLVRERDARGGLRAPQGVEPTNNRAEVRSVDQKPSLKLGGLVLGQNRR